MPGLLKRQPETSPCRRAMKPDVLLRARCPIRRTYATPDSHTDRHLLLRHPSCNANLLPPTPTTTYAQCFTRHHAYSYFPTDADALRNEARNAENASTPLTEPKPIHV